MLNTRQWHIDHTGILTISVPVRQTVLRISASPGVSVPAPPFTGASDGATRHRGPRQSWGCVPPSAILCTIYSGSGTKTPASTASRRRDDVIPHVQDGKNVEASLVSRADAAESPGQYHVEMYQPGLSIIYTTVLDKKGKGGTRLLRFHLCADGETRTRTGKLPPPPQSGASTISPHPLDLGLQR